MGLLLAFQSLSALAFCGPAARLDAPDFEERERATADLKAGGVLALPLLNRVARGRSPEAAFRARRLLVPWESLWLDVHATWVLFDPVQPDGPAFEADLDLRERVRTVGIRCGLAESQVWGLRDHEVSDLAGRWFQQRPYWADSYSALAEVRRAVRGTSGGADN